VHILLAIYLAGVAIGLWRVDGPPLTRVGLAVLWPVGPIAGLIVIAGLLLVSLVAFPRVGAVVAAVCVAAAAVWWLF
jgi:hypothetical protein